MARKPDTSAWSTRRAILDAALAQFAARGFHGASMRAIAKAAGVRESSIYHHFASKDAILDAVIAEFADFGRLLAESQLTQVEHLSLEEVLTNLATAVARQLQRPEIKNGIEISRSIGPDLFKVMPQLARYRERNLRLFASLMAELKRMGRMRADVVPEFFGLSFISPLIMATGLFQNNAPAMPPATLKKFIKAHVAAMIRAYGRVHE